jgi:hypothetical protein
VFTLWSGTGSVIQHETRGFATLTRPIETFVRTIVRRKVWVMVLETNSEISRHVILIMATEIQTITH